MRRVVQVLRGQRPGKSAVAVVIGIALGAGGIGWAATRSTSTLISACANADNALFLSPNGSCPANQTLVVWNQQGSQGPPGQQGPPGPAGQAPQPVLALGPSAYKNGFSIMAEIDKPGDYFIDGSSGLKLTPVPADNHHRSFFAFCNLYTGPPNGTATILARWKLLFKRLAANVYSPASVSGPVDVNGIVSLDRSHTPLDVYLACRGGPDAVWTHPAITYELTAGPSAFHPTVGPALPNTPTLGPGQIQKVFGGG